MLLAFDTHYSDEYAKTVCLAFEHWQDQQYAHVYSEIRTDIAAYEPGAFYKRELPCILSLLHQIPHTAPEAIIIDGFVFLDDDQQPGLGAHLYDHLDSKTPVIGVAKTNYATIGKLKRAVFRGKSKNPLYITAIGLDVDQAADSIASMHGEHRIPTFLKQLDQLTRI